MTPASATSGHLGSTENLTVTHGSDQTRIDALSDVSLSIEPGDCIALWGRSGSGKTTLLHALGGLVGPTSGTVWRHGEPLSSLDAAARGEARAGGIAYVFQGANLLPYFTSFENVAFAAAQRRRAGESIAKRAEEMLGLVGLLPKLESLPAELSGGEAQRVAIARALAQDPDLLLCDEPTGHLDSDTGTRVLDLILRLREEFGFALVIATHDAAVAARCDRTIELNDGRIASGGLGK